MIAVIARALLTSAVAWLVYKILNRLFRKNPLDNLPGPPGGSFLAGHFDELNNPEAWEYHKKLAENYGSVVKLRGAFGGNGLWVYDSKALHHIIVKDQPIFEETYGFMMGSNLIFGKGLFATEGNQHRKQRKMLNPVFSIAHMRDMIPIFHGIAAKLGDTFSKKVRNGPQEIEMLDWMNRTALELIGQSGLGYSFDPLTEDAEENYYTRGVKRFNELNMQLNLARHYILPLVYNLGTPKLRRLAIDLIPWKPLKEMRDVVDVMQYAADDVVASKKRAMKEGDEAGARQVGGGKDIISILLRANEKASEEDKLTDEEVVGQVSSLIFAAMDTTSNALSRTLYLLSHNTGIQDKLRKEIREAYADAGTDKLTYDDLVSLPYLDAVCRETLRIHPPVHTTVREVRQDVILPFSKPIRGRDGQEMTEVLVPKGTMVFPSMLSSNRDPDIWGPDSFEWKPERWIEGLPSSVAEAKIPGVYSHLMTFIGGGRACIGFKFSQLEMKEVLCTLLNKFKFAPVKGKEIEFKMTGVVTPTVVGEVGPQLPLMVSLAG